MLLEIYAEVANMSGAMGDSAELDFGSDDCNNRLGHIGSSSEEEVVYDLSADLHKKTLANRN